MEKHLPLGSPQSIGENQRVGTAQEKASGTPQKVMPLRSKGFQILPLIMVLRELLRWRSGVR